MPTPESSAASARCGCGVDLGAPYPHPCVLPEGHDGPCDGRSPEARSAAQGHVVAGQRWRSKDPRDDGLTATVLSTSGPGGFVYIQRFRKSRVRFERFVRDYELVQP